ncbi:FixH family protein [Vibrio coralliilyticus]|uniref:FixH family protein n=1 Tax=Vibrio coralliilyticus TaxID=190893 RepID=UPI00155F8F57|nr:FixH family protein [Vibrio coralliilyticus]NRF26006.1 FixH family protein [Vibrio coralliilyticus]NRF80175.1 FixH family protein [Vibrio coralliilyticus]
MEKPWYKQFWPWFILSLTVGVSILTLVRVAILTNHSIHLVTEDYYKKGKGINVDITRVKVTKELGLDATVRSEGDTVVIQFEKGQLDHYPAITAMFAHRTLPDHDFTKLVTSDASGQYRLKLDSELQGPWFIELTPHDEKWLIQGRVEFPTSSAVQLTN